MRDRDLQLYSKLFELIHSVLIPLEPEARSDLISWVDSDDTVRLFGGGNGDGNYTTQCGTHSLKVNLMISGHYQTINGVPRVEVPLILLEYMELEGYLLLPMFQVLDMVL
jgi:hypothetical protein